MSERGLVVAAVRHLTTDALGELTFEALGPTKSFLKRFFSAQPWVPSDEVGLAAAVGPGQGWWRHPLDDDLILAFGWVEGRFMIEVTSTSESTIASTSAAPGSVDDPSPPALAFDGPVTPEATPNPRTIMFRAGAIHEGQSRSYRAGEPVDDERVARLLQRFADIGDVMVATDFVAVTLRRPDRWEALLGPVLDVVTEEFAGESPLDGPVGGPVDDRISHRANPLSPAPASLAPVTAPRAAWSGPGGSSDLSVPSTPTTWSASEPRHRAWTPLTARWRPISYAMPTPRWP